jgi:hypothetical protein
MINHNKQILDLIYEGQVTLGLKHFSEYMERTSITKLEEYMFMERDFAERHSGEDMMNLMELRLPLKYIIKIVTNLNVYRYYMNAELIVKKFYIDKLYYYLFQKISDYEKLKIQLLA